MLLDLRQSAPVTLALMLLASTSCLAAGYSPAGEVRYGGTFRNPWIQANLSDATYQMMLSEQVIHWSDTPPVHRVQVGLETLEHHQDWRKRKAAIDDLLWHPNERVERALINALRDPVLAVRETAVLALGKVGTNQCLVPLMDAMKYSPGPIRDSIGETLRRLTGEDYGRHLDRWWNWREANRGAIR